MQYGFFFDNSRCTGCRTCVLACKDAKNLSQTQAFRKVFDVEGGMTTVDEEGVASSTAYCFHVSAACNHCANPGCIAATGMDGTIVKDEETGLVLIVDAEGIADPETVAACCPYGVPFVDEQTGLLMKCDGCYDRVVAGKRPICVEACPLRALEFGDIEELRAAHPDCVDQIAPLASGELTGPSLCIKPSPAALAAGDDGMVMNGKEIAGVPAWA